MIPLIWVRFPYISPNNFAAVAPMVEQRIENSCVTGSSPVCGTKFISHWASGYASLFGTRKSKVRVLHGRPKFTRFVYRLGHLVFNQVRAVQLRYRVPIHPDSSVVEQRLDKPLVASSNLAPGTKFQDRRWVRVPANLVTVGLTVMTL